MWPARLAVPFCHGLRGCCAVCGLLLGTSSLPAQYQLPKVTGARTTFASDDDFLAYVEQQSFNYFWAVQDPTTGLVPDRASNPDVCSIAAVGFGLSSINVAVSRGWVTRAEARARVLTTLQFLSGLPQGDATSGMSGYRGWFYHFLDTRTGLRIWNSELSTIDTALLMLGVHDCQLFYDDATNADEAAIRAAAVALLERIDWGFVLRSDKLVAMAWDPVAGFENGGWAGYNEAMALYLLGLGAATNPLPAESWTAWTSTYQWRTHYGYSYVWTWGGSLFTYQYSHCWIDFTGISDPFLRTTGDGIDYFINSRRATLAQQAYAANKPFPNYSATEFGITACDGPNASIGGVTYAGYEGRGAPPGPPTTLDDGTLAATAVLGSMPFAPEACLPAARHLYDTYRSDIWSDYGFCDAFNITAGRWFDPDVVGISAGANVLMLENYRSGSVWRRMLGSPILQRGLSRAGFTAPPPQDVAAVARSATQIDVTWTNVSNFATGFEVDVSTDGGSTYAAVASVVATSGSASFTSRSGTTYLVRVRTNSAAGLSGVRTAVSVTTPATLAITSQPAGISATVGQSVSLSVTATGTGTLRYQWYKDGAAVSGATGATLSFATVQLADAGNYTVIISDSAGSITSQGAALTVKAAAPVVSSGSGGGGGGAPSVEFVLALGMLALMRAKRCGSRT